MRATLLPALLAATVLAGCDVAPSSQADDFPPLGLSAMEAELNARRAATQATAQLAAQTDDLPASAQAAPQPSRATAAPTVVATAVTAAPVAQAPAATPARSAAPARSPAAAPADLGTQVQAQIATFREICGLAVQTGGIEASREAALSRGFRETGTSSRNAYGFSGFTVLDNGEGTQIQLSGAPGLATLTTRVALCSVVSRDSGGSKGVFDAAASAIAADNGAPLEPKTFFSFGFDEWGKSQFRVPGRVIRLDWQDRPFGLVLYILRD